MKCLKETFKKLENLLRQLNIRQAKSVQFLADGANGIWPGIKKVFRSLKIPFSKITLTLDYYHAVEHLKELSDYLDYSEEKQKVVIQEWKDILWSGRTRLMINDFKKRMKQQKRTITQEMKTAYNYFKKHHDRMQYSKYKRHKLLVGSGLVESAVRRIINLRFKGASSFWKKDNLEKLIFLRCAFLAGRWHNLLNNCQIYLNKFGTV